MPPTAIRISRIPWRALPDGELPGCSPLTETARLRQSPHSREEMSRESGQIPDPHVLTNPRPQVSNLSGQIRDMPQHSHRYAVKLSSSVLAWLRHPVVHVGEQTLGY